MNRQELKNNLEKNYKLVAFVDFAEVSHTPTAAYKLLETVHKDVFANNERIVFYGNWPDIELVNHVARARDLLDIGEFFCIWQNDIEDAQEPGTGYQLADTVCPLLWSHLEIRHTGDVYPCCVNSTPVGNVNENSLVEIFNNNQMDLLRKQMSTGGRPDSCDHCWRLEKQGLSSNRQWHTGKGAHDFYSRWYDDIKIRSLDLKPSNTCNFKCRTCNPNNSSLIAAETKQFSAIPVEVERWDGYREYTWQELDNLLPTIENLDFFGGEPFLLKELPTFIQTAVDTDNCDHVRLHFNTNGSIFPNDIIDNIQKFKEVDIAISIDDIGSRFELTRGGTWSDVEANILQFKELESDSFKVYIFPTVNIQNVLYLDQLIAWAEQNQLVYKFNFLEFPRYYNINSMTDQARDLVVDKYQNSSNTQLQALANRVKNSAGSDGKMFVKQMKWFDYIRNQNFGSTHNEIARAMGYDLLSP
jgi:radical SAM protein with 4Fe4S-binding SPASM domain